MRSNDILHSLSGWTSATTDGFTYLLNNGNYGYYGPQPMFYLDGVPVDISYFGWQNINMLPLMAERIDSLTYSVDPAIHNQVFSESGYVDIHTTAPDTGFQVTGSLFLGNEAGDPGPWIYDSTKITPNVDRWGPDYSGQLSYNTENWFVRSSLFLRRNQPTDLTNHRRISYILNSARNYGEEPYKPIISSVLSGMIETGYRSANWKTTGRIIRSRNTDFIFYQPLGRELPAILNYRQIALLTSFSTPSSEWGFSLLYLNENRKVGHRSYSSDYELGWTEEDQTMSFSAERSFATFEWSSGMIYQTTKAREHSTLFNINPIFTIYSDIHYQFNDRYNLTAKGSLDFQKPNVEPTMRLGFSGSPATNWKMENQLVYSELLPRRQNSTAFWTLNGYSLLNQLSVSYDRDSPLTNNSFLKLATEHHVQLNSSIGFELMGRLIQHYRLNIPWTELTYAQNTHTKPEQFTYTSQHGMRGGLHLGISHHPTKNVSQKMTAHFRYTLSGSERYQTYWQQVPSRSLEYFLSMYPTEDLEFGLRVIWRGSTKWNEYSVLEGRRYRSLKPQYQFQYGTFHTRTPLF
ncbi:MAG: hypothetical protein U5K69_11560 [Balneolaceae bacterium]|nr:hypothetical protein [Balneolaceae bacterium]